jgi:hypothetical protein
MRDPPARGEYSLWSIFCLLICMLGVCHGTTLVSDYGQGKWTSFDGKVKSWCGG